MGIITDIKVGHVPQQARRSGSLEGGMSGIRVPNRADRSVFSRDFGAMPPSQEQRRKQQVDLACPEAREGIRCPDAYHEKKYQAKLWNNSVNHSINQSINTIHFNKRKTSINQVSINTRKEKKMKIKDKKSKYQTRQDTKIPDQTRDFTWLWTRAVNWKSQEYIKVQVRISRFVSCALGVGVIQVFPGRGRYSKLYPDIV